MSLSTLLLRTRVDLSNLKLRSLTDQVYEFLSASIVEGRIRSGEKLLEQNLCKEFGISRSPLRECFRILESEGLIIISARRGAYVRDVTRKDIKDFFQVRAKLESLAAGLAVQNITEQEIETLNRLIVEMEEADKKRDTKSLFRLNDTFHNIFVKASNNEVLQRTVRTIGKGIWHRIAFLYFQSPSGFDFSNEKHKKIVKAFKKRDVHSVEKLVEEHFARTQEQLLSFWDEAVSGDLMIKGNIK
jgi:DNA-binding GntR family transcriptional regulator